ncbi:dienelactone hydrolase [Novosphingobium sp. PhB165]|uniref:dienelactone hydrolase family protein n=1 Tax=Novosphingobium sp. PhB165 TaxID=2485105 RepID=UPI00104FBF81|nr:dienelactone hydrolase family protein [Novosphingobium sp. PhB165]TCM19545.1 dienelactone hydrolase [Novosphingobium sp. PhB165]
MKGFESLECEHDDVVLRGLLVRPDAGVSHAPAPGGAVLMFPGATGPSDSFFQAMREIAAGGRLVVAPDMYGVGADLSTNAAAGTYFAALMAKPALLRERLLVWFERVRALPDVDPERIAAIGYCFGGKCVLELARSGAPVRSVTSFHGLLGTHAPAQPGAVRARVAVWTGGEDPYAPPADVEALRAELDAAGVDYQLTLFAKVAHAFTDPDHDGIAPGIAYDRTAHRIAWNGTIALLEESIDL